MDEDLVETDVPTVGERLRAAREEQGYSLEDIAAQTRIPRRHLENIELGEWDNLPAPTYTVGFAKSYASALGLDRTEIGEQLRAEMGGRRATIASAAEVFEPADPARTMPKWLVFSAIAAVILVVLVLGWLNERSLSEPDAAAPANEVVAQAPAPPAPAAQQQPAAQGPVVLTATEAVWLSVKDGTNKLKEGLMQPGESYQVPATATAPLLTVGKPEALRVTVGTATAPAVGPPGKVASKVSLLAADLMRGGQPSATGAPAAPQPPTG